MTKKFKNQLSENEQVYLKFLKKKNRPVTIKEIQEKIVRDDGETLQAHHYTFLRSLEKKGMIVRRGTMGSYTWSCQDQNV